SSRAGRSNPFLLKRRLDCLVGPNARPAMTAFRPWADRAEGFSWRRLRRIMACAAIEKRQGNAMDIGISLPTPADPSAIVAEAEERGFHSAWLYDSQMLYADLFIGMGLAAKATRRIRIGSGVL